MNLIVINTNYPSKKNNAEYNLLNEQLKAIEGNFEKIFLIPTGEVYCIPKNFKIVIKYSRILEVLKTEFILIFNLFYLILNIY